jgi:hypothetical protein
MAQSKKTLANRALLNDLTVNELIRALSTARIDAPAEGWAVVVVKIDGRHYPIERVSIGPGGHVILDLGAAFLFHN